MKQDTNIREGFPVETRVAATGYGGLQLATVNGEINSADCIL